MDWTDIDQRLEIINRRTCILRKLRPINLQQESRIFFNSSDYNPQFEYPLIKYSYTKDIAELNAMKLDDSPLGILFDRKRDELLKKINLIGAIGTSEISRESQKIFGKLNQEIIKKAEKELQGYVKVKEGLRLKFDEVKKIIAETFAEYNLSGWKVIEKDRVADCTRARNHILLRPNTSFSRERLKKTLAHEVETHVLRKENGAGQPFKIFEYGTAGHESTEEGLAIFNERLVSDKKDEKRFWPAAYAVAVNIAQKSSFRKVYEAMRWYNFSKTRAWLIATKVKRGIKNTEKPGGYTKDYIYYAGKEMVDRFILSGGKISDLYIGKVGIQDLEIIKKTIGIKKPKLIPKFIEQYEKNRRS